MRSNQFDHDVSDCCDEHEHSYCHYHLDGRLGNYAEYYHYSAVSFDGLDPESFDEYCDEYCDEYYHEYSDIYKYFNDCHIRHRKYHRDYSYSDDFPDTDQFRYSNDLDYVHIDRD